MELRKCKDCGEEKELKDFDKTQRWYRHRCKKCQRKKFQPPTGKINTGRFQKGHAPWSKGKKNIEKRAEPRYKKRPRKLGTGRGCDLYTQWFESVMNRDEFKCQHCGSVDDLMAHHIIKWDEDESKRFDVDNGQTLCRSCHSRHHRLEEHKNGIDSFSEWRKKRALT